MHLRLTGVSKLVTDMGCINILSKCGIKLSLVQRSYVKANISDLHLQSKK